VPGKQRSAEEDGYFKGMGLAIVELRESRGTSKSDLASKAKVVPSTLRRIELGETNAKWGTLRRLALALQIPLDAMIEMAEELSPGVGREARRDKPDHSP
jgi:transcriptional regulator with XRE-family HTH domain